MRKRLNILLAIVMSVAMVFIFGCAPTPTAPEGTSPTEPAAQPAEVIKWKMQTFMGSGSSVFARDTLFCDKVRSVTKGRLDITLFPAGALFPDLDVESAVGSGVADLSHSYCLFYQDAIPEAILFSAFFTYGLDGWDDGQELMQYYEVNGVKIGDIWQEKLAEHNMKRVAAVCDSSGEPIWSNVPINSIEDFEGLKIRMTGFAGNLFSDVLGASVVLLPGSEIYTALQTGTIDATEFGSGSIDYDFGIHEVCGYRIMPAYLGESQCDYLVNLDSYGALPSDVRELFDLCCDWYGPYTVGCMRQEDKAAIRKMAEEGMETIYLPETDVAELKSIGAAYLEGFYGKISPDGDRILDIYYDYLKNVKGIE